jgi:hypothetical protein
MAEETTTVGMSADGANVFSTGIDMKGRKVVKWATADVPGQLDDGTQWFLSDKEKK